ncbi:diacylglycerol/lipid kinase family protein [Falsiporphyromonas endometrii]|uniref:Diacylglycerol/lipid kinase family protein n=1 Tax=Falsiporphyromonas endometrii TaxID=1387297 RepID=A0ABV9K7F3_9PORP|nr:diacylglycerol kinase family lipid kinase [Porphyromonadaceae bacterium]
MKILAIINPISGISGKNKIPSLLAKAIQNTDYELVVSYTKYAGHASEIAAEAVKEGISAVIAVGGDGTVNEIASSLKYSGVPLGIIPKGSGNGLARALDIPMSVKGAIDRIVQGKIRTIDCCLANEHAFFCTCGFGFDAQVSKDFADASHRGPLQYMITTVTTFMKYDAQHFRVTIGDETLEQDAFLVTIANASQYGNNAYIAPGAKLDDGLVDVIVIGPMPQIEGPKLALQLFRGNIDTNKRFCRYATDKLTVERPYEGPVHLDGEPVVLPKKVEIKVLPGAIKVLA